jgi:UDP-glucose 4-epimerase
LTTVLITGASGLLGNSLCRRLSQSGLGVIGATHLPVGQGSPNVEYRNVDFSSDWSVESLPQKVDFIIHLAQSANFRDFPNSAMDIFKVNIDSTARLLDYARKVGARQFIYASSGGVYGNGVEAFNENANIVPPGQLGYYLGSKTCGEILVQSYSSVFKVVVLRPFFIYGRGQKRSMLIPRLMDAVASGKSITLQGENGICINPIHVEDASLAVTSALDLRENATFNIAGPDVLSIRQICDEMGKYLGRKPIYDCQEGRSNDLIADISAMRGQLINPKIKLLKSFNDVA